MKICKNEKCKKEFDPKPTWCQYCSPKCRNQRVHREHHARHSKKRTDSASIYIRTPKGRYRQFLGIAGVQGHDMTLSFEEVCILWVQPCHYCGGTLPETGKGIDRVDSSLGYVHGNVVPCCTSCNRAKNAMSLVEFKLWVLKVYQHFAKP